MVSTVNSRGYAITTILGPLGAAVNVAALRRQFDIY